MSALEDLANAQADLIAGRLERVMKKLGHELEQGGDDGEVFLDPGPRVQLALIYEDAEGNTTKRPISISKINKNADGERYLNGYCWMRRGPRCFKCDRIVEAIDLETGEVIEDFDEWEFAPASMSQQLRAIEKELSVLTFLGHSDGELVQREADIIVNYIFDELIDPEFSDEHANAVIRRWDVDQVAFFEALGTLSRRKRPLARSFVRALKSVVLADGVLHDMENRVLKEISEQWPSLGEALLS